MIVRMEVMKMPKWTPEQQEAIEESGTNIIVSAGAGSGKTAVLSERVINKLLNGIHINELLILTFTRAAADEMKDRIRKKIKENPSLKEESKALESAYITTFDSFTLSIVKKYHYLLNISKNIQITEDSIVKIAEDKILNDIFEEYYSQNNENFNYLIDKYCTKDDSYIRNNVKNLIDKFANYLDKKEKLQKLQTDYLDDKFIERVLIDLETEINRRKQLVALDLEDLRHYFDTDYIEKIEKIILPILNTDTLDTFLCTSPIKLPPVPKNTEESAKERKSILKKSLDNLFDLHEYGNKEQITSDILSTQKIIKIISKIISDFFDIFEQYKKNNNIYTFQDIASLAIKILTEHEDIRLEFKKSFKEIMIDEYQDTNDIQEIIVGMIASNNVYMVGDIKQSIYKFRGSNPSIFKEKYDKYSQNDNGLKIDLIKNFRSREEVLENINRIFKLIMDNDLGGAEYYESHEMVFGNTAYNEKKEKDFDYNLNVLEYENSTNKDFSNEEIEIFAIAKDIKQKIENKTMVFDKNTSELRESTYSDFVIILDRSKYFDLYKRIFEYLDIPLTILKDGKLNASDDISIVKNIIDFLIRIENKDYGLEYKYDFLSIGRSFLYEYDDNYLFDTIAKNQIRETNLFKDLSSIKNLYSMNVNDLLKEIIERTHFYDKIYKIGDYANVNVRISSIESITKSMVNLGMSIDEFRDYLETIIKDNYEIKYSEWNTSSDSVKIMTIHKSKGLEYPFCYFADLDHDFNTTELKGKFIYDDSYGLIVPVDSEDSNDSILKLLYKEKFLKEEIGEKIRLFYVALTRAREKMIIVLPGKETAKLEKNENGVINLSRRLQFKKLSDFIYASKPYVREYFNTINLNDIALTKNYLYDKQFNELKCTNNVEFTVNELHIDNKELTERHYSKEVKNIINKEERAKLEFGTKLHSYLQYIDFKNKNCQIEDTYIDGLISKMLKNELFANIQKSTIYKEYEFYYNNKTDEYHGIIDLMLEYEDHIDIVDYKLKNISDEKYLDQLHGYKDYIKTITDKKINLYLYSILDNKITSIN